MANRLHIGSSKRRIPSPAAKSLRTSSLEGKTVTFCRDGVDLFGVVKSMLSDDRAEVSLALPNQKGVLEVTDTAHTLETGALVPFEGVTAGQKKVRAWDANLALDKKTTEVKSEEGSVIDYLDVTIEGYLSTFGNVDRDGDVVDKAAFSSSIASFKRNPVLLIDHVNSVGHLAGGFTKIGTDDKGLNIQAKLSNAPELRRERFLVAEGYLKTLSMGGFFFFDDEDYKLIKEVDLFEGSLTPVPANPEAIFDVRSLTLVDATKFLKRFHSTNTRIAHT